MNATTIEWADFTWNPITGCLHGCPYCYARRAAEDGPYLRGRAGYDAVQPFAPAFHPHKLREPLLRKRPALIFVVSMGDALGDWVPREWIEQIINTCRAAEWHRFLWLTKNPERYADFTWPENCWLGTSVTGYGDQQGVEYYRLVHLAAAAETKAPGRTFISLEPFTARSPYILRLPHTAAAAWVIIGAQTNPTLLPSREALLAMYGEARDSGARVFMKDSILPVWNEAHNNELLPPREWPEGLRLEHGKSSK